MMGLSRFDLEFLAALNHDRYKSGSEIRSEILTSRLENGIKREPSLSQFYVSARRLEAEGSVEARYRTAEEMDPDAFRRRGYRKEREYRLTSSGLRRRYELEEKDAPDTLDGRIAPASG